jgi:hypothetical protein
MIRALVCGCWGCCTAPDTGDCFYREMKGPNHALELTAARTVFTFSMTTFLPPYLTLAVASGG